MSGYRTDGSENLERRDGEDGSSAAGAPVSQNAMTATTSASVIEQPASFPLRLADVLPGGVAYLDEQLVFTFCNDVQASYYGMTIEAVVGRSLYEVAPDMPHYRQDIEHAMQSGESSPQFALTVTWPARIEDGEHHYLVNYRADTDGAGRIHGLFMTALDVTRSVIDSQEVERGLRARTKALEETLRERDLLIGVVSHELRTPLTTIFGNALLLMKRLEQMDPEVRFQAIRDIHEEADRLNKLVENMLLLAQAGGQTPLHPEPVLVWKAIDEVVAEHRSRFPDRPIVVSVKPQDVIAVGDFDYTKQIIHNLLGNAEKYSPPTKQIDVRARCSGSNVVISIWDNGPGIPAEEAVLIFTPFFRSPTTAKKARGTGIGLSVCKLLVEAQSGRIWHRPRRGGGSIFAFSSPALLQRETE